jgi:hypothetical protein
LWGKERPGQETTGTVVFQQQRFHQLAKRGIVARLIQKGGASFGRHIQSDFEQFLCGLLLVFHRSYPDRRRSLLKVLHPGGERDAY